MELKTKIIDFQRSYVFSTQSGSVRSVKNVLLMIQHDEYFGIGEIALGTHPSDNPEILITELHSLFETVDIKNYSIQEITRLTKEKNIPSPARAGLDMALWDLFGKICHQPCHKIYGLPSKKIATSITIGANNPDIIQYQIASLLNRTKAKTIKIKLGSKEGIEKDKNTFLCAYQFTKSFKLAIKVDANAGWSYSQAKHMMTWLSAYNVISVEQPLAVEDSSAQKKLFKRRCLPIFLDESCHSTSDVLQNTSCCDGIIIKLMKSGSIIDAFQTSAIAKAHGLKTILGCKSESIVGISASLAISTAFDDTELDSFLYIDDPARDQILLSDTYLEPASTPGFGMPLLTFKRENL